MIINIFQSSKLCIEHVSINTELFFSLFEKRNSDWFYKKDENIQANIEELPKIETGNQFTNLLQTGFL
jgi:hypothetical protein